MMNQVYRLNIQNSFFQENNITFIIARTHAAFAERQIRTVKDMIHKRLKNSEDDQWTDHIGYVLLTYTHKMINNTKHMTPYDARRSWLII